MSDWKTRLLEEKRALDERLEKLKSFISGSAFETLDTAEKDRLFAQVAVMTKYAQILAERIGAMDESDGVAGDRTLEGKEG